MREQNRCVNKRKQWKDATATSSSLTSNSPEELNILEHNEFYLISSVTLYRDMYSKSYIVFFVPRSTSVMCQEQIELLNVLSNPRLNNCF